MNKQGINGIEWANFTLNILAGCHHDCGWLMPNGETAICYAETTANGVAQAAYPHGFKHMYWRPHLLAEPLKHKEPARIFVGSMTDVFGHWVPTEHIQAILDMCSKADWHTFQFLTKNAQRLRQFSFPPNCWVGVSAPPSEMLGKPLNRAQQDRWFTVGVSALMDCDAAVKWVSFEPLSYDIADVLPTKLFQDIQWAVIGAASSGKTYYQPEPAWTSDLIARLRYFDTPIFFKGNLKPSLNKAFSIWREEFPGVKAKAPEQQILVQKSLF